MEFREAKISERREYYTKEWKLKDLPDFLKNSLQFREFAFDRDGNGPNDRYNSFQSLRDLEIYLKKNFPYACYTSVSYYKKPWKRGEYFKAELVFDIDAKDLPLKPCGCSVGEVCEACLEDAKRIAFLVIDTLRSDFGLSKIYLVYSGRGYHVRVLDEEAMEVEERGHIFEYVTASKVPKDLFMQKGYSRIFRKMFSFAFERVEKLNLKNFEKVLEEREKILKTLRERNRREFENLKIGKKTKERLFSEIALLNSRLLDGKVTIDTKRILRMPSSLHSKVSMKCVLVENWEKFDPLRDAVPRFVLEKRKL